MANITIEFGIGQQHRLGTDGKMRKLEIKRPNSVANTPDGNIHI